MDFIPRLLARIFGSKIMRGLIVLFFLAVLVSAGFDMRGVALIFVIVVGIMALSYAAQAYADRKATARYAPRKPTKAVKRLRPVPRVEYYREPIHEASEAEFPEMVMHLPPKLRGLVAKGLSEEAKKQTL